MFKMFRNGQIKRMRSDDIAKVCGKSSHICFSAAEWSLALNKVRKVSAALHLTHNSQVD